jgi:hypothetical protein
LKVDWAGRYAVAQMNSSLSRHIREERSIHIIQKTSTNPKLQTRRKLLI